MGFRRFSLADLRSFGAICILSAAAAFQDASLAASPQEQPQLDNGLLRVTFDANTGQLCGFKDLRNNHEFIANKPDGGIWRVDLLGQSTDSILEPPEAREFRCAKPSEDGNEIVLTWEGFEGHEAPGARVVVEVRLGEREPTSLWRIALEGAESLRASAVRFPCISWIAPQDDELLSVPVWMGQQTSHARDLLCGGESAKRLEWEYPGILSMQCLAFYRRNGPGFYAACDDTSAFAKRFAMVGDKGRNVGFELTQLLENGGARGARYESPYRAILGAFEGDWFTAAERYRAWGLKQPWAQHSRLNDGLVADWVTKTGLWVWNRGRSEGVLGPALAMEERAKMPVSVFWHWWHGCAYDVGFPEYLPPREGAEPFQTTLRHAQTNGIHALVYMNQRLWGMTTRSWTEEDAERYAVKGPDGKVHPEVYNRFTHAPCASMCMGTAFWRNRYAGLAEEAVRGLGVDGIYMDQACSSLACFDPTHGHPLGGGTYWMNGFRLLQADIRARCDPVRRVVLAGEGCGEAWLPYLDLMLSLQVSMERYAQPGAWEPIPFFHAVYHSAGLSYGNYSSLTMPPYDELWPAQYAPKEPLQLLDRKFSAQFRLEQARAFVWGQQPTIANFRPEQFEKRADEIEYVLRLARLRCQALGYLQHGTMLPPPAVPVPDEEIDMSRLSIYAGQQERLKEFRRSCPSVLASAWEAADHGVAVVLANVTDRPQRFTLRLDRGIYSIRESSRVYIRDGAGRGPAEYKAEGNWARVEVELAPADAQIYEFEQ